MNDRQNTVVATVIAGLLLLTVYFCPWRVQTTGEITWSPIYQTPISHVQSHDDRRSNQGRSWLEYEDAKIAVDLLLLQVLVLGAVGGGLYLLAADPEENESSESQNVRE